MHSRLRCFWALSPRHGVMSVRPSACIRPACTGRIYIKFNTNDFHKIWLENPNLVNTEEKIRALYMKTSLRFIFTHFIKSPIKALSSNEMLSGCQHRRGGINITRTRHSIRLYVSLILFRINLIVLVWEALKCTLSWTCCNTSTPLLPCLFCIAFYVVWHLRF